MKNLKNIIEIFFRYQIFLFSIEDNKYLTKILNRSLNYLRAQLLNKSRIRIFKMISSFFKNNRNCSKKFLSRFECIFWQYIKVGHRRNSKCGVHNRKYAFHCSFVLIWFFSIENEVLKSILYGPNTCLVLDMTLNQFIKYKKNFFITQFYWP